MPCESATVPAAVSFVNQWAPQPLSANRRMGRRPKGSKSEDLPLAASIQIRFRDKSADENLTVHIQLPHGVCGKAEKSMLQVARVYGLP